MLSSRNPTHAITDSPFGGENVVTKAPRHEKFKCQMGKNQAGSTSRLATLAGSRCPTFSRDSLPVGWLAS